MVDTPVSTTKRKWQMKRRMPITLPGSRMSRAALAVLIGVAVISMSELPGLKAQGNSAVALSNGGEGWEASAAIDGAGNSVAVWMQRSRTPFIVDEIWSRGHPANGQWGEKSVLSGTLQNSRGIPGGSCGVVWSGDCRLEQHRRNLDGRPLPRRHLESVTVDRAGAIPHPPRLRDELAGRRRTALGKRG
jgi:hypothetical protein